MKISEMKTKDLDTFIDLIDYATNFLENEYFKNFLKDVANRKNADGKIDTVIFFQALIDNKKTLIQKVLKTHQKDLLNIVSIITEKTIEELEEQSLIQTLADAYSIFQDEELINFFSSLKK